ncbi:glycosyltransferase family 4 protein [Candidatus Pelagibacter sp.]|nr:glycosyltransferase family 4 protein [Candidatus Pelagibacter sp.]
MKISILLPYKENFSPSYPGAISIFLKNTILKSKYKKMINVYGNTKFQKKLTNNYVNLDFKRSFFKSSTKSYLDKFIEKEIKNKSDIIEVHNRPKYINKLSKYFDNLVLFFHNDPIDMTNSKSASDRIELLNKTKKIIFNSSWTKKRFLLNLKLNKTQKNKLQIIYQSTNKVKISLSNKKNNIIFVGRLNKSKGYDVFGKSIIKILDKYINWRATVIGDEPREKLSFKHKNLNILGFRKHDFTLNELGKSSICVVCSRWEEPFGRIALEASSRGCAVIITNKGGLKEAATDPLIINKLNEKTLYNALNKLIANNRLRKKMQICSLKNFYLTNEFISNKIDSCRNGIFKS